MYPARLKGSKKHPKLAVIGAAVVLGACVVVLVSVAKPAGATFPGVNGKIAFVSGRTTGEGVDNPTADSEIFTINPDGTDLHQVTHNETNDYDPAYSPDGKRIAYGAVDDSGGDAEIFTIAAEGGTPTQVTYDAIENKEPTYSPDGQRIAYSAADEPPSNTHDIFTIAADGGIPTNVTSTEYVPPCTTGEDGCDPYGSLPQAMEPSWSPDGQTIAYSGSLDAIGAHGQSEIFTIPATGGTPTQITGTNAKEPSWSPDGTRIAFNRYPPSDFGIYIVSADGGTRTFVGGAEGGQAPSWSPDGTRIAYSDFPENLDSGIYTMTVAGDSPTLVLANAGSPSWGPATASDCTIKGTEGADVLEGTPGSDTICGLGGNDTLLGGQGDDTLDGGPGTDTASFRDSATGVKASLTTNAATGEGSDTLTAIENLYGSADYDELVGSPENNLIEGKGGGDRLNGRSGSDAFWGGSGSDKFWGGSGNDRIVGDEGADVLLGESGDDRLNSRDFKVRNDTLDGGEGTDDCATDAKELSVVNCER